MNKYLVTAHFEWNEAAMRSSRSTEYIYQQLIDEQVIEHYAVSMEVQTAWITINAKTRAEREEAVVEDALQPKYWKLEVHELIIWDGQNYRLPVVQLN
jgi:hypothetical protein